MIPPPQNHEIAHTRKRQKSKKKEQRNYKTENIFQISNNKYSPMNIYFKWEWIKFPNQKTE